VASVSLPTSDDKLHAGATSESELPSSMESDSTGPRHSSGGLRRRVPLNPYALAGASRVGVQVVALLTMMSAVAKLDPATFGAFSLGWLVTVIGNTVLYTGLHQHLLRSVNLDVDREAVFWLLLVEGAAISLLMLAAGLVVRAVGDPAVATSLLTLAPLTLFSAGSAWCDSLLTRQQRTATIGLIYLVAEIAGALALMTALASGMRLWALLSWRLASTSTALLGLALVMDCRPHWGCSVPALRKAWKQALPLQGGTFVRTLAAYAADYLLAFFMNPAAAGAYRAASRVSVAGSDVFLQPLRPMTWEAMARHEREQSQRAMANAYLAQLRFVAFFATPVLACVALFSARLFATFASADWASAGPVLLLLALARVASMFDFFLDPILVCTNRSAYQFRLRTAQTVLLLLGVALTARHGPIAVALWQLICSAAVAVMATALIRRLLQVPMREVFYAALPAVAVTLLCSASGELTFHALAFSGAPQLIISITAMAGCLLVCFLLLHQRGLVRLPRY
jgi:O-antigen/teichoic acid export membrane protein